MKFLVDNQLPAALARWLVAQGSDAVHVLDCGLADAPDRMIWARACDEARIVVSKDGDFALLAANRIADVGRVLWVRVGNCRREASSLALSPHGRRSKMRSQTANGS